MISVILLVLSYTAYAATVQMVAFEIFRGPGCVGTGAVAPFGFANKCVQIPDENGTAVASAILGCNTKTFYPSSTDCTGRKFGPIPIINTLCRNGTEGQISSRVKCSSFTNPLRIDFRRGRNCTDNQPNPDFQVYVSPNVCSVRALAQLELSTFVDSFLVTPFTNGGGGQSYNVSFWNNQNCSGVPDKLFTVGGLGFGNCAVEITGNGGSGASSMSIASAVADADVPSSGFMQKPSILLSIVMVVMISFLSI